MAITVRQGNKADFDPESLQSGEWACVVDKKEAHLCFGDGVTRKMATYEEIEVLADSASASASTATTKATEASTYASTATTKASEASASASSASASASTASTKASEASTSASTASTKATEASTSASNALTSETNASASASSASTSAQTATTKASEASTSAQTATTKASEASASATSASNSASLVDGVIEQATAQATLSKSWTEGGTGVRDGENINNAKYWSDQAQAVAGGGVTSVNGKTGIVNLVPSDISLGNVPNVATNDQTPTYTEASTLETLTSGEKLSLSLGKVKKAISDLITHLADTVKHITSEERTKWNAKASTDVVTTSVNGLMSKEDKTKLNGVETGATNTVLDTTFNSASANTATSTAIATWVQAQIANGSLHKQIVETLPTTDISTNIIYMILKETASTDDIYNEYLNIDGTTTGWEFLGSTAVDLTNYYNKTEANNLFAFKAQTGDNANLNTTEKGTIVGAVCEVNNSLEEFKNILLPIAFPYGLPLIPTATTNTSNMTTDLSSREDIKYLAFDNDDITGCGTFPSPYYLQYTFDENTHVDTIRVCAIATSTPLYKISVSEDGTTFTDETTHATSGWVTKAVGKKIKAIRVVGNSGTSGSYPTFNTIQAYKNF